MITNANTRLRLENWRRSSGLPSNRKQWICSSGSGSSVENNKPDFIPSFRLFQELATSAPLLKPTSLSILAQPKQRQCQHEYEEIDSPCGLGMLNIAGANIQRLDTSELSTQQSPQLVASKVQRTESCIGEIFATASNILFEPSRSREPTCLLKCGIWFRNCINEHSVNTDFDLSTLFFHHYQYYVDCH